MTRLSFCATALILLLAVPAGAEPAFFPSSVNLHASAGDESEIVTKVPAGSLIDVTNCAEGWCEVQWQENKGFAMETSIDRSGRVPTSRPRRTRVAGAHAFGLPFIGAPFFSPYRPVRYRHYGRRHWAYRGWHW
jgi:uncharacterized protein YraI